jgi:phosphoglycerate kinase
MNKLTLKDIDLKNKKVLMRVDFNTPLDKNLQIKDDARIKAALPSINYILDHGASLILMSHLGRPKGKVNPEFSLMPCKERLSKLLNKEVIMANDCIGANVEKLASDLKPGQILLLENLRFHDAETHPEKDPSFAKDLSKLGDIYVNDAFGTAHRVHSSTTTITKYFQSNSICGFLLEKEIHYLSKLINNPPKPYHAIIGGKKISTKIGLIKNLISNINALFIGGGMSYTFLKAQNIEIGNSIFEEDQIQNAKEIIDLCKSKNVKLFLPIDLVIADDFSNDANFKTILVKDGITNGWEGVDIGKQTTDNWIEELKCAKSIFWNGPVGVFEFPNFAKGTNSLAIAISKMDILKIAGGGDSLSAINSLNLGDKYTHLSTGGGASLEYLEYGKLPAIEALTDR